MSFGGGGNLLTARYQLSPPGMSSKQFLIALVLAVKPHVSLTSLQRDRTQEEVRMGNDAIITGITRQDWLEPAEERLQKLLHQSFAGGGRGGQKIKNILHGTWLGHPLHVILTDVPIGAWTTALVFDFLELSTGRREFAAAADASITIGLIGAAGAAITGLTDWQDVDPPARRAGPWIVEPDGDFLIPGFAGDAQAQIPLCRTATGDIGVHGGNCCSLSGWELGL